MVLMQSLQLGEYFHVSLIYKTDDVLSKGSCLGREGEPFRVRGLLTRSSSLCLSAVRPHPGPRCLSCSSA